MNREQYEEMVRPEAAPLIRAADFTGVDRTLLYGYTTERLTWHVYLKGGLIHVLVYNHRDEVVSHEKAAQWHPAELVPNKRVYPESSDMALARMLRPVVDVPYHGRFDDMRYESVKDRLFHGLVQD